MKKYSLILKKIFIATGCLLISACSSWLDKDNTPAPAPLVQFKPEIQVNELWTARTNSGTDSDNLKLVPALNNDVIFTASQYGKVTASNATNGRTYWEQDTQIEITAGPASNSYLVVVGGSSGEVIALDPQSGHLRWKSQVSTEVLATPTIKNSIVLVKTVDGHVHALSSSDGHLLWTYQQTEPNLILRASSQPIVSDNHAIIGFANGNLAKLTLDEGSLVWQQTIANPNGSFAIERMVDIDANPLLFNHALFAATYQGRIASLDFTTGKILWTHDISTFSGIAADFDKVYVSDARGHVWAFDTKNGMVLWRQTQLEARNLTGPVTMGNYIVVGDAQGYLHWLDKQDGRFVGRIKVDGSGILATPVVERHILYVVTRKGRLAAYTVSS